MRSLLATRSPRRHGYSALLSLGTILLIGCSVGDTSTVQTTPAASERLYLSAYETSGGALRDASAQVGLNCQDTVVPALLCVVALEDALNASIAFEADIVDLTLPGRFGDAHRMLIKALAHAARGFDLWIEALRDRNATKLADARVELATASRVLHTSFEALPADVRPTITEPLLVN